MKGFSHAGISFHCIIFCLCEFPCKTKQIPKRPLSVLQDQREMSPPLPAPHGFSANLSHPWDTEDLCFPLVLFSAWWLLVSLVPSGLSISYLWCFSGRASVAAILGQAGDGRRGAWDGSGARALVDRELELRMLQGCHQRPL